VEISLLKDQFFQQFSAFFQQFSLPHLAAWLTGMKLSKLRGGGDGTYLAAPVAAS
jgi:hypothetical protein